MASMKLEEKGGRGKGMDATSCNDCIEAMARLSQESREVKNNDTSISFQNILEKRNVS